MSSEPCTLVVKPVAESIKQARDFVAGVAGALGLDDHVPRLVVSELATNAVRASGPHDHIVVRVLVHRERLVIEVWDQADGRPEIQASALTDEGGRGLYLLSFLVAGWGTRPLTEGGKIVYAEISLVEHANGAGRGV